MQRAALLQLSSHWRCLPESEKDQFYRLSDSLSDSHITPISWVWEFRNLEVWLSLAEDSESSEGQLHESSNDEVRLVRSSEIEGSLGVVFDAWPGAGHLRWGCFGDDRLQWSFGSKSS